MTSLLQKLMENTRNGITKTVEETRADLLREFDADTDQRQADHAIRAHIDQDEASHLSDWQVFDAQLRRQNPQPARDRYSIASLVRVAADAYLAGEMSDQDAEYINGVRYYCQAHSPYPTDGQQAVLNRIGRRLSLAGWIIDDIGR